MTEQIDLTTAEGIEVTPDPQFTEQNKCDCCGKPWLMVGGKAWPEFPHAYLYTARMRTAGHRAKGLCLYLGKYRDVEGKPVNDCTLGLYCKREMLEGGEWGAGMRVIDPDPDTDAAADKCLTRIQAIARPDIHDIYAVAKAIIEKDPRIHVALFGGKPDGVAVEQSDDRATGYGVN